MKKETLTPENDFLMIEYQGLSKQVNLENEDYICLNDLLEFFPDRKIDNWQRLKTTKKYIIVVENFLNRNYAPSHVREHKINAIYTLLGKGKKQGTYAHELIALEFLAWLSPEFKVLVFWQWNEWRKQNKPQKGYFPDALIEALRDELDAYFINNEDMEGISNHLVNFINQTKSELAYLREKEVFLSNKLYKIEQWLEQIMRQDNYPAFVYLMHNTQTQEYKLGKSDNPLNRKKQLQIIEPNIEIVLEIPLTSSRQAFSLEGFFKETFKSKNTHGEWYKLETLDVQKIRDFKSLILQE